ncbi:MAG: four helix bundle protein [Planctomycetota bacterium]
MGSAYELETHLRFVGDMQLAPTNRVDRTLSECDRAIGLLIGTLRGLGA